MKATRDVCTNNSYLHEEYYKNGRLLDNTQYTRDEAAKKGFLRKAKSDETRSKEAAERRYQNRNNVCGSCYQLKAVGTGRCACED